MNNLKQKTISSFFSFSGVGLHTGVVCRVNLSPAPENVGYIMSSDVSKCGTQISSETLIGGFLGSNVFLSGGDTVRTVEHFLAAIASLGITNLYIHVEGGEIPILDGSSQGFVSLFEKHGVVEQSDYLFDLSITAPLRFELEGKYLVIEPRVDGQKTIDVTIDFESPIVKKMPNKMTYILGSENFKNLVSSARTFGFQSDIDNLLSKNLCLGGGLDNAVVIGGSGVLNPDGLRMPNELVAHKVLDIIGDLSPIINRINGFNIVAYKPGHQLNNIALKGITSKLQSKPRIIGR